MSEKNNDEIKKDGQTLDDLLSQQEATPAESSTENEEKEDNDSSQESESTEDSKPAEEPEVPFHKHPRFKEIIKERDLLKKKLDELEEFKGETEKRLSSLKNEEQELPEFYKRAWGDDPELAKAFIDWQNEMRSNIEENLRKEITAEQEKAAQETEKYSVWVDEQLSSLESEGMKFDRNELMKLMVERKPSDEQGNLDFHIGYEMLKEKKELEELRKGRHKKEVSAATEPDHSSEPDLKKVFTSKDFRYKKWF